MTDRVIRVIMDPSGVEAGARRSGRALKGVETRTGAVARGLRAAQRAAAGLIAALGARELIRTADTFNRIQNRLRIVTDSTDELVRANERLFDIAQETRQPLEATVNLFTSASIAADELGASEEELFRLVEITGQALAVQGSSAAEASGALRQLSQSFSSGIVRAEEFNSILEGAFPLAQAAARGIDEAAGSVGKLRLLVVEGKITSQEFFEAILKGGEELGDQFSQTIPTVSQAMTTLSNSFITLVGQLDETTGITAALASGFVGLSSDLSTFGDAVTGTLSPTEELTTGMEVLTLTSITLGSGLSIAGSAIVLIKDLFVLAGDQIGKFAAQLGALITLDFDLLRNISNDATGFNTAIGDTTDFMESFANSVNSASERISGVLLPSFRELQDVQDDLAGDDGGPPKIIDPNAAEDVTDAREAVDEFLTSLENQETILALTADRGDEAGEAIIRYKESLALAAAEAEIFGELQPTEEVDELREAFRAFAQESIESQRLLRAEIEAADLAGTFDDQIEALEEEIELLGADTEALGANAEARALAAGATEAQAEKIGELTTTLADEQEALARETATLEGFFEEVGASAQRTLSGFLADPLSDGLDELPGKFAQVLQQLAADALASEIFSIIGGLASGGAGGGGAAGLVGLFGSFFGGGMAAGGQAMGGRPILVGERGPEIFTPPGSGSITPNVSINQAAQAAPTVVVNNITDPADIPAGLRTAEGEEEVINIIQRNPDAVRRILG